MAQVMQCLQCDKVPHDCLKFLVQLQILCLAPVMFAWGIRVVLLLTSSTAMDIIVEMIFQCCPFGLQDLIVSGPVLQGSSHKLKFFNGLPTSILVIVRFQVKAFNESLSSSILGSTSPFGLPLCFASSFGFLLSCSIGNNLALQARVCEFPASIFLWWLGSTMKVGSGMCAGMPPWLGR